MINPKETIAFIIEKSKNGFVLASFLI